MNITQGSYEGVEIGSSLKGVHSVSALSIAPIFRLSSVRLLLDSVSNRFFKRLHSFPLFVQVTKKTMVVVLLFLLWCVHV